MQVIIARGGPRPDFAISAAVVTVAGVAIDCAARQGDSQQVIDIRRQEGVAQEGVAQEGGSGYQLASVRIPPRHYVEVESESSRDGSDEPGTEREAQPLDPRQVEVTIWPAI